MVPELLHCGQVKRPEYYWTDQWSPGAFSGSLTSSRAKLAEWALTVVSDTFGKAGLAVLDRLASGVINAGQLAQAVTTKIKRKEDVEKALTNCFTVDHIFVLKKLMEHYYYLKEQLKAVERELREKAEPYRHLIEKLDEIPGIDEILAIGILAEATDDMKHFPDERAFAAWAGVAAGNNESAGKKKDQNVGPATLTCARSLFKQPTARS